MDYLEWNEAIGRYFFNPDRSGIRVFLYVTTDIVTEIGTLNTTSLDDFITAVKTGPPWNTRHGRGICQQALQALDNWRSRDLEYPPYLCYLALFVMADTVNVGFARHSYYPGLRSLLGEEPEAGMYPSFNQMYPLWDDLAVWSNQDKNGDWGIFEADIVGEWMHVGLPRAQTLLTDKERDGLPFLFAENGLDPYSPPSDSEIAFLLGADSHHYLRSHTKELLKSQNEGDYPIRAALLEVLINELEHWDGSVPDLPHMEEKTKSSFGNLRLVMVIDRTARTARFSLRCRSNREYPEEGLKLIGENMQKPFYCFEDWQGWSTPLFVTEAQTNVFDASHIDWLDGFSLIDCDHAWKAIFPKRSVRVMISAAPFGFDGFVENSQIPQGKPFYLIAHNKHAEILEKWGLECCDGFSEINLLSELPDEWHIYSVERANTDDLIRDTFPFLAFPTFLRIWFRGGLKVRGNHYFAFALPQVEVVGASEDVSVFCNDRQMEQDGETLFYVIPELISSSRLIIEVNRDGECICKKTLYTVETISWRDTTPKEYFNKFGQRIEGEAAEMYFGSVVKGVTPPEFNPESCLPPSAGHRVYFVGRNPGEIVECPMEIIPVDWQPIWAISMQKRGRGAVIYCGTEPIAEAPGTTTCKDRKRLRLWRDVLWYKRKRIACPSHPLLRDLWRSYIEVAHHVR